MWLPYVVVMWLPCGYHVVTILTVLVESIADKDMKKTWTLPSILNFTYLWMVGLMYCLQQLSVCAAMQYGQPGKTSLLKYLDVILPFGFQFLIFREYPDVWTLIGCGCIALSTISVMMVKRVKPINHQEFTDEPDVMETVAREETVVTMENQEEEQRTEIPKGHLQLQEN
eukprot:sb/3472221/